MNNKGYMLVEIILASFIAFGIAYFILNMTIKLKNKNDDLLVETQVKTDQTIIMNELMEYASSEKKDFDCNSLAKTGNVIKYKNKVIDIVSEYATVGDAECSNSDGIVSVKVPLGVKNMVDKNFEVVFYYNYGNY